ncbi:Gfo/Idh/MocA family protein [Luteimonas sp. A537]
MRVGIIGCGKIADGHAEQLRALDGVELVAACDREPLMVGQFTDRWPGVAGYTDVAAMLEAQRLDIVHVATPPDSHVALACMALDAGCHVFVEKPFALDARGAAAILDCATRNGRKACVNYLYNFESPALALRGLLDQGRLGEVVHIDTSYGYNLSGDYGIAVMSDPAHWVHRLPGKLFHNVIDHVLAKVVPFLEGPVEVHAKAWRMRADSGSALVDAMPDELRFLLAGSNGVTVSGMVSSHARPVSHAMTVRGTRDTVELDYGARTLVRSQRQQQPSAIGRLFPAWVQSARFARSGLGNVAAFARHDFHYFECMRVLLERFHEAIRGVAPDPVPAAEILQVATLIDAIVDAVDTTEARR